MIQALWSGSAGMMGQQLAIDNIANNVANVNTNGYKKAKIGFQDLLYQEMRTPGRTTLRGENVPTGYQLGSGVRVAGTQILFEQGAVQQTDNPMDYAIEGNAFFSVRMPNGTVAYTRDGSFKLDAAGTLVTSGGHPVLDSENNIMTFGDPKEVNIDAQGNVYRNVEGEGSTLVGNLNIVKFTNPAGLAKTGANLFVETVNSGQAAAAGQGDFRLRGSVVEASNVNMAEEMVDMMVANRAYEISSRVIRTSDEMLGMANQLLRR